MLAPGGFGRRGKVETDQLANYFARTGECAAGHTQRIIPGIHQAVGLVAGGVWQYIAGGDGRQPLRLFAQRVAGEGVVVLAVLQVREPQYLTTGVGQCLQHQWLASAVDVNLANAEAGIQSLAIEIDQVDLGEPYTVVPANFLTIAVD